MSIMKLIPFCTHMLRRTDQHMFIPERKEIGAFPHNTDFSCGVLRKNCFKFPFFQIFTGKQNYLSRNFFAAASYEHMVCSVIFPYLRITEINSAAFLRKHIPGDYRIFLCLYIIFSVTPGKALILPDFFFSIRQLFCCNSCVDQGLFSIRFNSTSGKASLSIIFLIRCKRCRKLLPSDHILRHTVAPVHRAPVTAVRMILVKKMYLSFKNRKSIGIIDPANRCRYMKGRFLFLRDIFCFLYFIKTCFFKFFTHTLLSLSFLCF